MHLVSLKPPFISLFLISGRMEPHGRQFVIVMAAGAGAIIAWASFVRLRKRMSNTTDISLMNLDAPIMGQVRA